MKPALLAAVLATSVVAKIVCKEQDVLGHPIDHIELPFGEQREVSYACRHEEVDESGKSDPQTINDDLLDVKCFFAKS